jgi:hypothetical protein
VRLLDHVRRKFVEAQDAPAALREEVLRAHREHLRQWCRATKDTFGGGHYAHPATPFMLPGDGYYGE